MICSSPYRLKTLQSSPLGVDFGTGGGLTRPGASMSQLDADLEGRYAHFRLVTGNSGCGTTPRASGARCCRTLSEVGRSLLGSSIHRRSAPDYRCWRPMNEKSIKLLGESDFAIEQDSKKNDADQKDECHGLPPSGSHSWLFPLNSPKKSQCNTDKI